MDGAAMRMGTASAPVFALVISNMMSASGGGGRAGMAAGAAGEAAQAPLGCVTFRANPHTCSI